MSVNAASGLRNLRAMFENRSSEQSNSPPSRGRSPSGSVASTSSRPVSKVRTSFVAVERPGDIGSGQQWGLRKASDVSSMAEIRDEHRSSIPEEQEPTSPHTTRELLAGGLGSILKGSAFDGTPTKSTPQPKPNGVSREGPKSNGIASKAAAMVEKMKSNERPQAPRASTLETTSGAQSIKPPQPKSVPATQAPSSPKVKTPKTPTSPATTKMNIRGGPAKIKGVMESARKAADEREVMKEDEPMKSPATDEGGPVSRTSTKPVQKSLPKPRSSLAPGKLQSAVTATTAARDSQKAETQIAEKPVPKPRSSMAMSKLPSAVTAKTTASAAKTDPAPAPVVKKSASRASLGGPRSARVPAETASSLAKKSSRASLANGERPTSRVSLAKPDDSFLARMARPTLASQNKTHDKVEVKGKQVSRGTSKSQRPRKSDQSQATSEQEQTILEEPAAEPNDANEGVTEDSPQSNGDHLASEPAAVGNNA